MRLIIMGQQAFGKDVLEKLIDAGTDEVVAVYCEPDREGKPADPIKEFALAQGLDFADCLEWGAAVAALKCRDWGGRRGLPERDEVFHLLDTGSGRSLAGLQSQVRELRD